ncbi:MAG: CopD family protein [Mariprofundaceae bacterium]|nr:CopD family protein [Mariprofundaceae bacterium]
MEWLKVFHIVMMVSWFAGLFYLPRLFVNHAAFDEGPVHDRLSMMEAKLYRFVTPMMLLTIISGSALTWMQWTYLQVETWFYLKLAIVLLLVGYHHYCGCLVKIFAQQRNARSHVFYRWFNEAPVFGLLFIVILVIVRPF